MRHNLKRTLPAYASRKVRFQPNYQDEVSAEYADALARRIDAEKPEGFKLTPVSDSGW